MSNKKVKIVCIYLFTEHFYLQGENKLKTNEFDLTVYNDFDNTQILKNYLLTVIHKLKGSVEKGR